MRLSTAVNHFVEQFVGDLSRSLLVVSVKDQQLHHFYNKQYKSSFPISTSAKGVGCQCGSYQTPIGLHKIKEKIGANAPKGEIFIGRQPQGKQACIESQAIATGEDAITSRIMWLTGLEPGVNQGGILDSYDRYIYIHGTNEEGLIGQPASIGCIRMKNKDVITLFGTVSEDDYVYIMDD